MNRSAVAAILIVILLFGGLAPSPAKAQIPVTDVINWVENAWAVIQQAYEIVQRYEVLYRQYLQYQSMLKNLENYDIDDFADLVGLYYRIDQLLTATNSLGYTAADVVDLMAEFYPGFEPPTDYYRQYADQAKRTLTTMRSIVAVANRISHNNQPSQFQLRDIQDKAQSSDGALEVAKAEISIGSHTAETLGKMLQTQLAVANAIALTTTHAVNAEAQATAAQQTWVGTSAGVSAPATHDTWSAIPRSWPWPCYGCGG